jgi:hypothetical protein
MLTPIGKGSFKAPTLEALLNATRTTQHRDVRGFLLEVG